MDEFDSNNVNWPYRKLSIGQPMRRLYWFAKRLFVFGCEPLSIATHFQFDPLAIPNIFAGILAYDLNKSDFKLATVRCIHSSAVIIVMVSLAWARVGGSLGWTSNWGVVRYQSIGMSLRITRVWSCSSDRAWALSTADMASETKHPPTWKLRQWGFSADRAKAAACVCLWRRTLQ